MDQAIQDRIQAAVSLKVSEVCTQWFPELIPDAVEIVQNQQLLCERHPAQADTWQAVCQSRLDQLVPQLLAKQVTAKYKALEQAANKAIAAYAQGRSWAKFVAQGKMDTARLVKAARKQANPKAFITAIVADYNACVEHIQTLEVQWSAEDQAVIDRANELAHRHNRMVVPVQRQMREFMDA
jgi:hypothetical protein